MTDKPGDALQKPPRRCTPEQFYADYLPALWDQLNGDITWPPWRFDIGFAVDGAGEFALGFDGGSLRGSAGAASNPLATIRVSMAAWELAVRDVIPRVIRHTNKRLEQARDDMRQFTTDLKPTSSPDRLADMPGVVIIDFTDDAGDSGTYRLEIGSGAGPEARIEAGDEDLWALLESRGRLVNLLQSRALIEGDVAYVIKLARYLEEG